MAESVTISNENDNESIIIIKEESNNNNKDIHNNGNPFITNHDVETDDLQLSDLSNSQHTTTNNTNHSTPHNSDSNTSLHSPINNESKSNTELSIDSNSHSEEDDDEELKENNGNVETAQTPMAQGCVSNAYRKLLIHESNRLKAENGRLLRKVEKMRTIRSSMQNIVSQLSNNNDQDDNKQQSADFEEEYNQRIRLRQQRMLRLSKTQKNKKYTMYIHPCTTR